MRFFVNATLIWGEAEMHERGDLMNDKNMAVLTNVIGAVESGGQIYGRRNYAAYAGPYTNSNVEYTVTLGWAQNYGSEAKKLIQMIYEKDRKTFQKIDKDGQIHSMLSHDWVKEKWNPNSSEKNTLIALIDSPAGHVCQNELFASLMQKCIKDCEAAYTKEVHAVMMYCEIRHLGGKGPVDRIFKRCSGDYTLNNIMSSLKQDQSDKTSSNQVGDLKFWTRHQKCREFIEKYAVAESGGKENSMSKIEQATQWMENHALDNKCGYDQQYRWGERGDYDCSAAVISAWQAAGVPVKTKGATYTGNMLKVFLRCGFHDVTKSINLRTGAGLKRGDVLLNTSHHTAMYCGNGREVEASINEKGRAVGGVPGDQTGREFLIRSYRNYPWTNVLRYSEGGTAIAGSTVLKRGDKGDAVKTMQQMLTTIGYGCGASGADGDFGTATYNALLSFQKAKGLIADGEYGDQSRAALTKAYDEARRKIVVTVDEAARNVLAGKYGNGDARRKAIEALGLSYNEVQKRVNQLLKNPNQNPVDEVAKEVLAGKWGNGASRRQKLTQAGFDANAVQKRVNELTK